MSLFTLLFLNKLGICPQNYIPRKNVDHREKFDFLEVGMLNFTYKGFFFDNKTGI
jgi:hypothetical protein